MSIDPADYWMTPDEERRLEDKLTTDNNNPDKSPCSVIPLGTIVKPYGEVSGVTNRGGERYYFMAGGIGVSLMPADLIEKMHSQNTKDNYERGTK